MPCVFRPSSLFRLLLGAALSVLISSAAWAQGMYYKEIAKDGRIYVFNIAANAERFEKSGEMGIGITKPGVGPNGETVIGDNERALQLYFFKHGIAEAVPEPPPPTQTIVWRDGKTRITTDNAYLEISNRVQVRFTDEFPDDNTQLPGTGARGDSRGSWRIRRAKFKLEGWMMRTWLTYETATELAGGHRRTTSAPLLEDAMFDVDLTQGQRPVPRARRAVQGAVRRAAADVVRQPDVRRPGARQRRVLPRPRHRRRPVGRDAEQQVRMAHSASSTATA